MKAVDLTGQRFGRLTALERVGTDKHRYALWLCRCDCGQEHVARGRHLRIGDTQSCGCLQREMALANGRLTKHGHYVGNRASPTYGSWTSMKARCLNPTDPSYARYGGRGISVCERWLTFPPFLEDMGERPIDRTLDRIDNDGNYEPGNCRWATASEQAGNRSIPSRLPRDPSQIEALPEWMTAEWMRKATAYLERSEAP